MSRFQFAVKKLIGIIINDVCDPNTQAAWNREGEREWKGSENGMKHAHHAYLIDNEWLDWNERKTQVIIVSYGSMSKCCVIIIFWFQNRLMS